MSEAYTKTAAAEAFSPAREQAARMERYLESDEAMAVEHAALEAYIEREGREYERRLMQAHLDLRALQEQRVEVRGADGVRRGYARSDQPRALMTVFGAVTVTRLAYQREGVEGLHPQDARLNLPEEFYSHGMRRLVAQAAAQHSFEQTHEVVVKAAGVSVGLRQLEELAARASVDFDAFYKSRESEPQQPGDLLALTFDGKGIVMRQEDLRPATRQAAQTSSHKLDKRLSKGEKRNRKRMAEVAAVYAIQPVARTVDQVLYGQDVDGTPPQRRPRPRNKRVWASVTHDLKQVVCQAFEAAARRDPDRNHQWVAQVDGNPEQLKWIKRAARKLRVRVAIVLDLMHVLEYLWSAACCFYPEGSPESERWVHRRLRALLEGRTGGQVARSLRRMADARQLSPAARKPVDACARYLINNTRLLHYDRALANGFPIATGVIEGACRHLVKARMDTARWSLAGAEAVLRLRALRMSRDFDEYWDFHLQHELERNHLTHYACRVVPVANCQQNAPRFLKKAA